MWDILVFVIISLVIYFYPKHLLFLWIGGGIGYAIGMLINTTLSGSGIDENLLIIYKYLFVILGASIGLYFEIKDNYIKNNLLNLIILPCFIFFVFSFFSVIIGLIVMLSYIIGMAVTIFIDMFFKFKVQLRQLLHLAFFLLTLEALSLISKNILMESLWHTEKLTKHINTSTMLDLLVLEILSFPAETFMFFINQFWFIYIAFILILIFMIKNKERLKYKITNFLRK